jgi:hypothetical protein
VLTPQQTLVLAVNLFADFDFTPIDSYVVLFACVDIFLHLKSPPSALPKWRALDMQNQTAGVKAA